MLTVMSACSVYHGARESLAPDVRTRLAQRLTDARTAEVTARDSARRALDGPACAACFERVEANARELSRRVLAAQDVAKLTEPSADDSAELARLKSRADTLEGFSGLIWTQDPETVRLGLRIWLGPAESGAPSSSTTSGTISSIHP